MEPLRLSAAQVAARIERAQDALRSEIRLLHERVGALLAAEAFLTIAYTGTMGSDGLWSRIVAPGLSILGLALALLSWAGVRSTAALVLRLTADHAHWSERDPVDGPAAPLLRARLPDQRRSLLFFRGVPLLFAITWSVFLVVALTLDGR